MVKMQMMTGLLTALGALAAVIAPQVAEKAPSDRWEDATPFEVQTVPDPAVQQQAALAADAVTKLDQMLQIVQSSQTERAEVLEQVATLSDFIAEVKQKVDENTLTKADVVRLVSTTVDEKTAETTDALKSAYGECNCNCDEQLGKVLSELAELKAMVAELKSRNVSTSATQITAGMDPNEVAARLKAMGYQSSAYGTRTVSSSGGGSSGNVSYNASYANTASSVASGGCTGSVAIVPQVVSAPPVVFQPPAVQTQANYDASFSSSTSTCSGPNCNVSSAGDSGGGGGLFGGGGGLGSRLKGRFGGR